MFCLICDYFVDNFLLSYCTHLKALKKIQNNLREDVNHFANQNIKLNTSVNDLESNISTMKTQEQQLKDITQDQTLNLQNLMTIIKQHKLVNREMKSCIKRWITSSLISIALNCDLDENGHYNDREMKRLMSHLRNIPAVSVNESKLHDKLTKEGRTLTSLINMIYTETAAAAATTTTTTSIGTTHIISSGTSDNSHKSSNDDEDPIFSIDETDPDLQQAMIQKEQQDQV